MNREQQMVWDFHTKFGFTRNMTPTLIDPELGLIRHKHTLEEMHELEMAIKSDDLVAIADALGDVLYFIIGTGVAYGVPLARVFSEIHHSNMTKDKPEGGGDKKAMKGRKYIPPNIESIIKQTKRAE